MQFTDIETADFLYSKINDADLRNARSVDKAIFDDNKKNAIFTDEDYKKTLSRKIN